MYTLNKLKGFSLIELILVIIILGILAAVSLPKMNLKTSDAVGIQLEGDLRACFVDITRDLLKNPSNTQNCSLSSLSALGASFTNNSGNISLNINLSSGQYDGRKLPDGFICSMQDNRRIVCS